MVLLSPERMRQLAPPEQRERLRTLYVAGTHPNEPTSLRHFADFCAADFWLPFTYCFGNEFAAGFVDAEEHGIDALKPDSSQPQRFVHQEMSSTSPGDLRSDCVEARRMYRLNHFYFPHFVQIIDEHNSFNDENYIVLGPKPAPVLMATLAAMGLRKVIVNDSNPYYLHNPHLATVEVDYSEPNELHDTAWWIEALTRVSMEELPPASPADFVFYWKLPPAKIKQALALGMAAISTPSFEDIPTAAKQTLGIDADHLAVGYDWHRHFGAPGVPGCVAVAGPPPTTWVQTA